MEETDQKYVNQHFDEDIIRKFMMMNIRCKIWRYNRRIQLSAPIEKLYIYKKPRWLSIRYNKKNIIKVYYSKDENKDQIPDKYQIKVMYACQ